MIGGYSEIKPRRSCTPIAIGIGRQLGIFPFVEKLQMVPRAKGLREGWNAD